MSRRTACVRNAIVVVCLIALSSSQGWATTYFVSTYGSDTHDGAESRPWRTIQKAADALLPGDEVVVTAGTYDERVQIRTSGLPDLPIRYRAQGTVLMAGFTLVADYIHIHGFNIKNTHVRYPDGIGIYVIGRSNLLENNVLHHLLWEGIWLFAGATRDSEQTSGNIVRRNVIFHVRQAGIMLEGVNNIVEENSISHTIQHPPGAPSRSGADADGIRFFGSGHIIRKNFIHDILPTDAGNVDPHIDCFQTWGPAVNMIFEQNICYGDRQEFQVAMISNRDGAVGSLTFRNNIFDGASRGINLSAVPDSTLPNLVVVNNTFRNVAEAAILLSHAPAAKIQNNLFYDVNHPSDLYVEVKNGEAPDLQVGYNARYATTGAPGASPFANDLWLYDPQVVNASGRDFHLQPTSPLIDAGIALPEVTHDYDGVARPQGAAVDIGAFEFRVPASVVLNPPLEPMADE